MFVANVLTLCLHPTFSYLSMNWQKLCEHRTFARSFTKLVIGPAPLHWIKIRISQTLEEGPGVVFLSLDAHAVIFPSSDSGRRLTDIFLLCNLSLSLILATYIFPFGGENWRKVSAFLGLNPQVCLTRDKETIFIFTFNSPESSRTTVSYAGRGKPVHGNVYMWFFIEGRCSSLTTGSVRQMLFLSFSFVSNLWLTHLQHTCRKST